MKVNIVFLAFFAGLTALPSLTAGEQKPNPSRLEACPYGHTTLTNIPIRYGLVLPADIENSKQAQDNYEYVPGGCGFHPGESPTNAILCSECKFLYQLYNLSNPDEGYWNRRSKDRQSFRNIFPALIQEFPLPDAKLLLEPPDFSQGFLITKDVHEMIYVYGVNFTTKESVESIKDQIEQYLEKHNLKTQPKNEHGMYKWESKEPRLTIIIYTHPTGTNDVRISITQKENREKPNRLAGTEP